MQSFSLCKRFPTPRVGEALFLTETSRGTVPVVDDGLTLARSWKRITHILRSREGLLIPRNNLR